MAMTAWLRQNISRLLTLGLLLISLVVTPAATAATSQPRDPGNNPIMYNGAYSKTEWQTKYKNGDGHHSAANLQAIYKKWGVTEANFMSKDTVDGVVFKDGHVEVNGKTVATGVVTVGRENVPGSKLVDGLYEHQPKDTFAVNSIQAWVNMQNGTFHYLILKSCGNPGRATPTPTPKPTPKPTPSTTPKPTPEQSFSCVSLTPSQPDKTKQPDLFRFTVKSQIKNVTLSGYRFTVTQTSKADATSDVRDTDASKDYAEFKLGEGTWKVQAQVKTTAGITQQSEACTATANVTVKATPSPKPTTPATGGGQVLGATLPQTGPEVALGGFAGVAALGYASRAYLRSRKSVVDALRRKR